MSDKESALRACMNPNPIIDGRKANVNLAYLGAKPRSNQLAGIAAAAAAGELPLCLSTPTPVVLCCFVLCRVVLRCVALSSSLVFEFARRRV